MENKTETEIAKENLKLYRNGTISSHYKCSEHKQTCQRWLEFLFETIGRQPEEHDKSFNRNFIDEKVIDLNSAIKLYEKAGIK